MAKINLLRDEARREAHPEDRNRSTHAFKCYKTSLMKVFGFSRISPDDEADPHLNGERDTSDGDTEMDEGSSGNRMENDLGGSLECINAEQYDTAPVGWTEEQQASTHQFKPDGNDAADTKSAAVHAPCRLGLSAENPIVIDGDDEHLYASTFGVAVHGAQSAAVTKEECPPLKHPRVPTNGTRRVNDPFYRLSRSELAIEQFMDNFASSYAVADRVCFAPPM